MMAGSTTTTTTVHIVYLSVRICLMGICAIGISSAGATNVLVKFVVHCYQLLLVRSASWILSAPTGALSTLKATDIAVPQVPNIIGKITMLGMLLVTGAVNCETAVVALAWQARNSARRVGAIRAHGRVLSRSVPHLGVQQSQRRENRRHALVRLTRSR